MVDPCTRLALVYTHHMPRSIPDTPDARAGHPGWAHDVPGVGARSHQGADVVGHPAALQQQLPGGVAPWILGPHHLPVHLALVRRTQQEARRQQRLHTRCVVTAHRDTHKFKEQT